MLVDNLALVCAAAFAAIALYISFVEHPARMGLSDRGALAEWQPSYKGAAAIQAPLALLGGVFGFLSYILTSDWVWLLGAVALLANWPYTMFVIQPVNDALLAMEPDKAPPEARGLLNQWARLHLVRTALGLAATIVFIWVAV